MSLRVVVFAVALATGTASLLRAGKRNEVSSVDDQSLSSQAETVESFAVTAEELQEARQAIKHEAKIESKKLKKLWSGSKDVDGKKLASLFLHTYRYSADNSFKLFEDDSTVFVSTGDIGQMWLRDSSVQLSAYLGLAARSPEGSAIRKVMESAMARQRRFIFDDPYGSAFFDKHGPLDGPHKEECPPSDTCPQCTCTECAPACGLYTYQKDWELDSLLFPLLLHYTYWKQTGSTSHMNAELTKVMKTSLQVMRTEQSHTAKSKYFYKPIGGSFAQDIGLVWSFALPSDDQAGAFYNIPENMMAAVVLEKAAEMAAGPLGDAKLAAECKALSSEIDAAVKKYGIVKNDAGKDMYAFSVDGNGGQEEMDDANLPNLLWLPFFNVNHSYTHDATYQTTREFVLSTGDKNFFGHGKLQGLGSQHHSFGLARDGNRCDGDCIWHLGLGIQGLTANSREEKVKVMNEILRTDAGTNLLHEGFEADNPGSYNRDGFGFANSAFAQWALRDWTTNNL